jgi:phage terminase large subunit
VNRPFAYAFKREKSIRAGLKLNNEHPIILSFDFNVDPITCLACQSYGESVRVLREFRLRNSDIFALCSEIKKYYQGKEFIVTGDASGANRSAMTKGAMNYYMIIKEELNVPRSNFKVPTFNPSIKNSRVLLNSMLEKYGDFYIDSSCEFLINDLLYVESDWAGNIDKTKDSSKTHLLDCLRYYLWTFHSNFVKYLKK